MYPGLMASYSANTVLCLGGAHIDRICRTYASPVMGTSNPGTVRRDRGGVARNVAENLVRLGCQTTLLSRVGRDEEGQHVLSHAEANGIETSLVTVSEECATGSYTAIIGDDGEMVIALADAEIYREITPSLLAPLLPRLRQFPFWFVDSNLSAAAMETLFAGAEAAKVCVGAVSMAKVERLRPLLGQFDVLFANAREGAYLADLPDAAEPSETAVALRERGCQSGVLTASHDRIVVWSGEEMVSLPTLRVRAQDVTGAGDSLAAGTIYGLMRGLSLPAAVQWGLAAASVTVQAQHTVSPTINTQTLEARMARGA